MLLIRLNLIEFHCYLRSLVADMNYCMWTD